ncbi:MAG TPA: hypothetical protein VEQ10_01260 [Vicinamibacteria bacterium]|nr:hypothetical protein [Vicinamibacteria bacterium]
MPQQALTTVSLAAGVAAALDQVPAAAGVVQLLGPEGRSLVLGIASNLRRWAGSRLGAGAAAASGRRPKTDLSGIATAVAWVLTRGPFHQRLTYERLMAPLVPVSARRDLKPPAFLHLDAGERFPRLSVRGAEALGPHDFGPFRDRRTAEKARDAVQRAFALRPCDLVFEPDPAWAPGLACLYAQVRSCAAPCLGRTDEAAYRRSAEQVAAWLSEPGARSEAPAAVPGHVAAAIGSLALIVDAGRHEVGLFPVRDGRVLDDAAATATPETIESAVAALGWPDSEGPADWPWLTSWLRGARARACWLCLSPGEAAKALAARVRQVLAARGDKVGATRGST